MADTKSSASESSNQSDQALARREDERGLRRRESGDWWSNPFHFVNRMAEEMDRTFDRMFQDVGMPRQSWLARTPFGSSDREGFWSPRVEMFQKGDRFVVRADLPGLKKDEVQVELTEDTLTIEGERREEREEKREGYVHSEREYGKFCRSIPLPQGVISETAQASFKNGVLEVTMQASPAEANRGRRLEIQESSERGEKK